MAKIFANGMAGLGKKKLPVWARGLVKNWNGQPVFQSTTKIVGGALVVHCKPTGPNAQKWIWVSQGTKPHTIKPKNSPVLIFSTGYQPKTKPGNFFAGPGLSEGPTVVARSVNHPGTEPRNFEKKWIEWVKAWWPDEARALIKKGLRAA